MTRMYSKMLSLSSVAALVLSSAVTIAEPGKNDTWNKIMKSGKITVGVKADTKPWGFLDTDGNLIGMEADMAKEVADTMGVELELVGVQSSNRMQFLE
jgi:polar amino acid transport system substrate-binding protein